MHETEYNEFVLLQIAGFDGNVPNPVSGRVTAEGGRTQPQASPDSDTLDLPRADR